MAAGRRSCIDFHCPRSHLVRSPRPRQNRRWIAILCRFAYTECHIPFGLDVSPETTSCGLAADPVSAFSNRVLDDRKHRRVGPLPCWSCVPRRSVTCRGAAGSQNTQKRKPCNPYNFGDRLIFRAHEFHFIAFLKHLETNSVCEERLREEHCTWAKTKSREMVNRLLINNHELTSVSVYLRNSPVCPGFRLEH